MATKAAIKPKYATMADVYARIGDVPPERILMFPAPGTATEQDLLDNSITGDRAVELVDGILVEKPMGARAEYLGFDAKTPLLSEDRLLHFAGGDLNGNIVNKTRIAD